MIRLTTEQAQQIEEALDKLNSVYGLHETPCVAKALAAIRAARAQEQAEQELFDMDDHPPHRLCECRKCMEYFTPLPDCDAFAAFGKPIAEQTNTQLMEGFRPVSEMIAEHKQDPKKAAAIEKAKMRKAEQEPEEQLSELGYAARLARELCKKHYPDCSENWKPLDSLYGVLTQIDNMVSGLIRNTQSVQEPVGEVVMESMGVGDAQIVRFRMNGRIPPVGTKLYAAPVQREPVTIDAAEKMGATGAEPTEAERQLFEAWMKGHCWAVTGVWDGKTYRGSAEHGGHLDTSAMHVRRLWAAWRDRAALAAPQPVQQADLTDDELHQIWRDIKSLVGLYSFQEIARAVIAAYKEKNK